MAFAISNKLSSSTDASPTLAVDVGTASSTAGLEREGLGRTAKALLVGG